MKQMAGYQDRGNRKKEGVRTPGFYLIALPSAGIKADSMGSTSYSKAAARTAAGEYSRTT